MHYPSLDIIGEIDNYLDSTNLRLLNKEIHYIIHQNDKLYRKKYEKYLNDLNLNFLILDNRVYDYIWKHEYGRILKYEKWQSPANLWQLFNGANMMQKLDLRRQKLKEVPKEIGCIVNLRELRLDNNQLKKIPKEIGNLINLQILTLESNNITKLPNEICNLINLQELWIIDNKLKKVPKEITKLVNLRELWLFGNHIQDFPDLPKRSLNYERESPYLLKIYILYGFIILFIILKFWL